MWPPDGPYDPSPVYQPQRSRRWRLPSAGPLRALLGPLVVAAMLALAIYVALQLPWALVEAWPLYLVATSPALGLLIATALRGDERLATPTRPETAAQWLRRRLDRLGLGTTIIRSLGPRTFFASTIDTIALAENVHDERTMFAHAAAAHELGHAWLQGRAPRRARLALWSREHGGHLWRTGFGMLFGAAMTGAHPLLPVAFALLSAALLASVVVLIEEAAASSVALRELAASGVAQDELGVARRSLRAALGTYLGPTLGHAVPLVLAPLLCTFFGEGLLPMGPGLSPGARQLVDLLAWGLLGGGVLLAVQSAVALAARRTEAPTQSEGLQHSVLALITLALPLLCWQEPPANAAPIITALAALRVWDLAYLPAGIAASLLSKLVGRLEREPTALAPRPSLRSSLSDLATLARLRAKPSAASRHGSALWLLAPAIPLALLLLG